jgi:hypothetical protein
MEDDVLEFRESLNGSKESGVSEKSAEEITGSPAQ